MFAFKETMPIVIALGNKNLQKHHWEQIQNDILKVDFDLEKKDFNLGTLIDLNVIQYQDEIISVSICSSQEASLEAQLKWIEATWDSLELKVKMYKENMFVLTDLDDIQLQLDDLLTNINNVMGNRYILRLKEKGEKLQEKLNLFTDIFDQWKECQNNWLYLENIFLSEDIKAQTKNDYADFEKVNKSITAIMASVNKDNKLKKQCTGKNFDDLSRNNKQMDKIQKSLETFLENKRKEFPRFFFLSNDELLQILAAAQDIRKVEKHCSKIFCNVMKLKLGEDSNSNQIYAIISAEGESVTYQTPIKARSEEKIEATLAEIEQKMVETITKKLSKFYGDYDFTNIDKSSWVFNDIGQVVSAFSQIIWTEL